MASIVALITIKPIIINPKEDLPVSTKYWVRRIIRANGNVIDHFVGRRYPRGSKFRVTAIAATNTGPQVAGKITDLKISSKCREENLVFMNPIAVRVRE